MNDCEKKDIESDVIRLWKGGTDVETLPRYMREKRFSEADSLRPANEFDMGLRPTHRHEN